MIQIMAHTPIFRRISDIYAEYFLNYEHSVHIKFVPLQRQNLTPSDNFGYEKRISKFTETVCQQIKMQ